MKNTTTQHTPGPKKETAYSIAQAVMFSAISNACEFSGEAMSCESEYLTEKQKAEVYKHMRKIARRMVKYTGYMPNHFMNEAAEVEIYETYRQEAHAAIAKAEGRE